MVPIADIRLLRAARLRSLQAVHPARLGLIVPIWNIPSPGPNRIGQSDRASGENGPQPRSGVVGLMNMELARAEAIGLFCCPSG